MKPIDTIIGSLSGSLTIMEKWTNNLGFGFLFLTLVLSWIEFNFWDYTDTKKQKHISTGDHGGLSTANPGGISPADPWKPRKTQLSIGTGNHSLSTTGMITANLFIGTGLALRWYDSGHFPLSNLYESLIFLSWTTTFIHLMIQPQLGAKGAFGESGGRLANQFYDLSWLGMLTCPTALIFNGFADFSLPDEMQKAGSLVPALQSNWLMMHVSLMILSYAALILGSLCSILYLVVSFNKPSGSPKGQDHLSEADPLRVSHSDSLRLPRPGFDEGAPRARPEGALSEADHRVIWEESLDNISYRLIGLGFPLLTIGIISGAVWANEAWGSYWSWDPKETWALITWLNFAIYLHSRLNKGWEGKEPAYVATAGLFIIWICYLGVNLLGKGLHSYGFF